MKPKHWTTIKNQLKDFNQNWLNLIKSPLFIADDFHPQVEFPLKFTFAPKSQNECVYFPVNWGGRKYGKICSLTFSLDRPLGQRLRLHRWREQVLFALCARKKSLHKICYKVLLNDLLKNKNIVCVVVSSSFRFSYILMCFNAVYFFLSLILWILIFTLILVFVLNLREKLGDFNGWLQHNYIFYAYK